MACRVPRGVVSLCGIRRGFATFGAFVEAETPRTRCVTVKAFLQPVSRWTSRAISGQ